MRVVVTGGAGHVGTYVVQELAAAGHTVTVFDRQPPKSGERISWVRGNILDFGEVISVLSGHEVAVHLAAIPLPGTVPDHVLFQTNLMGSYNVHEAAARSGLRRVVSTSSTAIVGWTYGQRVFAPEYLPIDEGHPLFPHDPYGLAKVCEEQVARSYAFKSDIETVVLRLARVLFPDECAELRRKGGMRPQRLNLCAYVDARDVASAFRRAVEVDGFKSEVLFIVADDSSAAEPLSEVLPRFIPDLGDKAQKLTGTRSSVSNARAKAVLQWKPEWSWRKAGDHA